MQCLLSVDVELGGVMGLIINALASLKKAEATGTSAETKRKESGKKLRRNVNACMGTRGKV